MFVRIAGVGFSHELDVPEATTLEVALGQANIENGNLQARVGGEAVDPASYQLNEGDTIVLSPPDVKLGA